MTSGLLRPLRPFTVGYRWTKSCKPVTGKLTTHLQQYVFGTRSGGTTSPRSFPSDQLSSERKKGGGAHPLQPSLQESLPGSRYSFTFKMLRVRSFCFLLIKYFVLRTYLVVINLIFRWQKFMRCPTIGLVSHS